ncbi:MAG: ribonuclease H family protein [Lentimicrobiaceae bacterium]
MGKQKYYVVWKGRETGIFKSWAKCEEQVKGFDAARYKSFDTESEAIKAFAAGAPPFSRTKSAQLHTPAGDPVLPSICVDAACSGNPGVMEYQGVDNTTRNRIFHNGPYPEGTVNIGEFLAIVHGLGYLKLRGLSIPVYSDSNTAIKWVKDKKTNTKLVRNEINRELFNLIERAEYWLKHNSYDNPVIKWNTKAWGESYADFGRK